MIELFFDFISPYSYLAFTQAKALGARVGREVEPKPVLLAGILNALGTKGPAEVPARRAYLMKDLLRAAHRAGVSIALPPTHPFNPLPALRVAALDLDPALRWRIVDALFTATWGGAGGIEGADRVAAVLREAGIEPADLVARAHAEGKERLRRNTDDALARGAFGVPTLFVDGEMFFGFDSFPAIEAFVRGEDPAAKSPHLVEQWARLPASASRPKGQT
jgi:2-hydroxychromene-2-carboxylate isomerase